MKKAGTGRAATLVSAVALATYTGEPPNERDLRWWEEVVLVERLPPDDPDGIPARAVDWYDIGEWR